MGKRLTAGDRIFLIVDYIILLFVMIITLYPFIYVVSASISDPGALARGEVWLLPKGFSLDAYRRVFDNPQIWNSYYNTIWYVVVGTAINLFMTIITAYPLSRKSFSGRSTIMMLIAFTMFFGGGMVPTYLLIKELGLLNTRWAIVLPGAISTWNLIIMRTFFESIPESLQEAAIIDGCNDISILARIVLPLSMPVIAVMVLFYAVAHWNSYFNALLYLNDQKLYPLQMVLRQILIQLEGNEMIQDLTEGREATSQTVRYATIIVAIVPIICVYPFLQKYFVKGVMIGAIKG